MRLIKSGFINSENLKTREPYQSHTPAPNTDDYTQMYDDIKLNRQQTPIITDGNHIVIDGHTRLKILNELQITKIKFTQYDFINDEEKLQFIDSKNVKRRHLTIHQKCQWAKTYYKEEKQAAKNRQHKGTLGSQDSKGKAVEKAAKKAGVSGSTFKKFLDIEKSPEKHKYQKDLESGKKQIKTVHTLVTRKQRNKPKAQMPKGQFDIIYCDVPISFEDKGTRGSAEHHYSTMTIQELIDAEFTKTLPITNNAVIFFWIPPSMLTEGLAIVTAWGFHYKTNFTWDKQSIGVGTWVRNQHEHLLIAVKGKMPPPAESFSSIIPEKRSRHSKKPEIVYSMIETMYPKRNYLELFARQKRKGWQAFGNQLEVTS